MVTLKVMLRNLDRRIQDEIVEAKRIQAQVKCSWGEALRLARDNTERRW